MNHLTNLLAKIQLHSKKKKIPSGLTDTLAIYTICLAQNQDRESIVLGVGIEPFKLHNLQEDYYNLPDVWKWFDRGLEAKLHWPLSESFQGFCVTNIAWFKCMGLLNGESTRFRKVCNVSRIVHSRWTKALARWYSTCFIYFDMCEKIYLLSN